MPFPPLATRYELLEDAVQMCLRLWSILPLVARYGDACSLRPGPDIPDTLDSLRRLCDQAGRDFGQIERTCAFAFDPDDRGPGSEQLLGQLGWWPGPASTRSSAASTVTTPAGQSSDWPVTSCPPRPRSNPDPTRHKGPDHERR